MAVSLSKGGNVSLSKEAPGLKNIIVGLGWDPRATDGKEFDLDASVFVCGENGKVRSDADFVSTTIRSGPTARSNTKATTDLAKARVTTNK